MNEIGPVGERRDGSPSSTDLAVIGTVNASDVGEGSIATVVRSDGTRASFRLSDRATERIRRSVPDETRRAYTGDWARYTKWAAQHDLAALPTDAAVLAEYATFLADTGKAPATIERALAAIAAAHRAAGLDVPLKTFARQVLRDHKRQLADAGWEVRQAAPVTITVLRVMLTAIIVANRPPTVGQNEAREIDRPLRPIQLRDTLLLLLGFAIGARRSNLARLNLSDVTVTDAGLEVRIRRSKTDQDAEGRKVWIPRGQNPATCPLLAFQAWRDRLAAHGITTGPLFIRIDRHGRLGHVATGRGSPDGRITGQAVAIIVNRTARAAGLDPTKCWAGHSLRAGFATSSYDAHGDLLRTGRHGGWVDGSKALLRYIRSVDDQNNNALVGVGM